MYRKVSVIGRNRPFRSRRAQVSRMFSGSNDARIGRNLYRQLIHWCNTADAAIPLSSFIPPVTITAPHVDEESLQTLAASTDSSYWKQLLPPKSKVEAHQITVPIHNSKDAKNLFRVIFRMNDRKEPSPDVLKQRTSIAFEAIKSLNELSHVLKALQEQREKHLDRTNVLYHVGQVVRHKTERWRGIVIGWQRKDDENSKLSSLTTKEYGDETLGQEALDMPTASDGVEDSILYSLIVDSGDAHLLGGARQIHDGSPVALQSDLELVKDESLIRIRSHWTAQQFGRFDASSRRFVPNEAKTFEYPLDNSDVSEEDGSIDRRRNELGSQVVAGVQQFASRLERRILDATSCSESRGLGILSSFEERFSSLANGDVVPNSAFLSVKDVSQADLAIYHLHQLLQITLELSGLLWIRRVSKEHQDSVQFAVGDVVRHKKYGFRGVIVAWDPKPAYDVSRWDGLTDIENASDFPFYHITPDQGDCIEAFGGERPSRYVCEANLELCPLEKSFIGVDLDPGWERECPSEPKYTPPEDVRFKYAASREDDDDVTESCLGSIMDEISQLQVSVREVSDAADLDLTDVANKLSMATMFEMLKLSDTMDGATVLEETIKETWKAHRDSELRFKLDCGIADLLGSKKKCALATFQQLVDDDPHYAEAWNKVSTCHFMLGDMQSSLEAAERTLELLPRHFQAMNGLGLVRYETRRYELATKSFRRSLSLDPWSAVSARLGVCLDKLLPGGDLEEEGASEGTAPYER